MTGCCNVELKTLSSVVSGRFHRPAHIAKMSERAGLLFTGLLLIFVPSCVLGGECSGEGVFEGRGTFSGEGVFESEAGTFEGTGVFVGRNGASFEGKAFFEQFCSCVSIGSGSCEVSARVQSVEGTRINVTGNGMFNGNGIFEVSSETSTRF